jgi:hypothetical protein
MDQMSEPGKGGLAPATERTSPRRRWRLALAFVALSVFMYASIMYKIINYGP